MKDGTLFPSKGHNWKEDLKPQRGSPSTIHCPALPPLLLETLYSDHTFVREGDKNSAIRAKKSRNISMDAESYFEIWVPFFLPYEVLQGSSVTPMLLALLTPGAERECEWMWVCVVHTVKPRPSGPEEHPVSPG